MNSISRIFNFLFGFFVFGPFVAILILLGLFWSWVLALHLMGFM